MRQFLILLVLFILSQSCGYVGETPTLTTVKAGNIQTSGNTIASTDTNGNINISPNGSGEVAMASTNSPLRTTRTSTATTGVLGVQRIGQSTTNNAADTFGASLVFEMSDSGVSNSILGDTGFERAGADNTGAFFIRNWVAGSATEYFRISPAGAITGPTSIDVDNLFLNGNDISSQDVNGDITITPNGTGKLNVPYLTASLPVQTDASKNLVSAAINIATQTTGILPIANGGTNSSTALSGSSIAISNGSAIVQGAAGTSSTLLHGNASGAPTYGAVDLASEVSGTLPIANGGIGATTLAGAGIVSGPASAIDSEVVLFDSTTGKLIKRATGTGFAKLTSGVLSTSSTVNAATELTGITPVTNGGTGATTLAGANIVTNAGTSTDNAIARYDLATGKIIQDSSATIDDNGQLLLTSTGSPLKAIRTSTDTSGILGVARILHQTSADAIDDFGPSITFDMSDSGVSNSILGDIGFVRNGADNTGSLVIRNWVAGVATEFMRITGLGVWSGATQLNVENLRMDLNTISSTNTNGNVILSPNGTGFVNIPYLTASMPTITDASKNLISSLISLTTHVSGVLPIGNGGTNSSTALSGSSIMVSNGTAIVQGSAGTTTTVLHGNASGVPTYGAVSLTADVSGILPEANGGTGASTFAAALATANGVTNSGTSVDNCIPTFDSTTGKIVQCNATGNTIADSGSMTLTATAQALRAIRTGTATNSIVGAVRMAHLTTNDAVDGFGTGLVFDMTDSGVTNSILAQIAGVRAGGDTTGDFVIQTNNAGSLTEKFRTTASGQVAIGTSTPAASAKLDVSSTTQGFLPPRMTTTQRDAITAVAGLVIYNSTTSKHQGYNGSTWNDFY